jgi:hypothetical protein
MKNEIGWWVVWLIGRYQERKAARQPVDPNWKIVKWCARVVACCIIFAVFMSKVS